MTLEQEGLETYIKGHDEETSKARLEILRAEFSKLYDAALERAAEQGKQTYLTQQRGSSLDGVLPKNVKPGRGEDK